MYAIKTITEEYIKPKGCPPHRPPLETCQHPGTYPGRGSKTSQIWYFPDKMSSAVTHYHKRSPHQMLIFELKQYKCPVIRSGPNQSQYQTHSDRLTSLMGCIGYCLSFPNPPNDCQKSHKCYHELIMTLRVLLLMS